MSLKWLRTFALTNTFLLRNAKAKKTAARSTSIDAFIHASITTWGTANTDSAAISHTPSKDKSIDLNHLNKPAKSCIMKTTVPPDPNVDSHTISENTHVSTTQSQNANSQMLTVDTHTKKNSTSQLSVFLTSWADAPTTKTAKMPTTSITSSSISPTMDPFEKPHSYTTFIIIISFIFIPIQTNLNHIYWQIYSTSKINRYQFFIFFVINLLKSLYWIKRDQ